MGDRRDEVGALPVQQRPPAAAAQPHRDADDLPRVVAEAFHIARSGRPGPVHIDITKDALQQETRAEHPSEAEIVAGQPTDLSGRAQLAYLTAATDAVLAGRWA